MTFFSYDGVEFETHSTEAEAKAVAENAMENYQDEAMDGWDDASTDICYGKVTHGVIVKEIEKTEENKDLALWSQCDSMEEHRLEKLDVPDLTDALEDILKVIKSSESFGWIDVSQEQLATIKEIATKSLGITTAPEH